MTTILIPKKTFALVYACIPFTVFYTADTGDDFQVFRLSIKATSAKTVLFVCKIQTGTTKKIKVMIIIMIKYMLYMTLLQAKRN